MGKVTIPQGLWWGPMGPMNVSGSTPCWGLVTIGTMDAAGEKVAQYGHVYIANRPSGAKTLSSSGGKLHVRTGAVTWATAGTTLRVGIQDVATGAGPPIQPDGTFDVYDDLVQGTDSLSSATWTTITMSAGSKSITHGDLIALVCDMTARNGSDSVIITGLDTDKSNVPGSSTFGTAWGYGADTAPNCIIEFDDGTLGWFDETGFPGATTSTQENWQDSTNPDERGNIFRVPWSCDIDGLHLAPETPASASADAQINLYSDPFGTPTLLASLPLLGEHEPGTVHYRLAKLLSSVVALQPGRDYALAIKATGTSNISYQIAELANANYRQAIAGIIEPTSFGYTTRNGGSGAFAAVTTTKFFPLLGVRICAIDTGPAPSYQLGI